MAAVQDAKPGASLHLSRQMRMRFGLIALIAFLTLVDLFAAQAILPSLVIKFGVSRATMGFAVNASTFGMAVAGLVVALFGRNIDRRRGIWISLCCAGHSDDAAGDDHDIAAFAAARSAGPVHVHGLHADHGLSGRAFFRRPAPPALLRPMSPATSPAISSAACCRPRLPTHSDLDATS